MADLGSGAALTTQQKRGRGLKLKERLHSFSLRSRSRGHENPGERKKEPGIIKGQQEPASEIGSTTELVASVPSIVIEKPHQSSLDVTAEMSAQPIHDAPTTVDTLPPIHELWNQAYDQLKQEEKKLMTDYEAIICGDLTTMIGSTVIFSGSKVDRKEQMTVLLGNKVEEVKKNSWKLKFGSKDIPLTDLAQPVVGVIQWADDYISGALSANPYASLAWGGVSLLLPLTLNPSKQAVALANGLDETSGLIVRSTMRERLYELRLQIHSKCHDEDLETFWTSQKMYRNTLKALYVQVLKFHANIICYLSKKGALRLGLDMIKWNDWESSLNDVRKSEGEFNHVYAIWKDIWKDVKYREDVSRLEEDNQILFTRHQDNMNVMISISGDISGLRTAVENEQRDMKRSNLLTWLSSIDPSKFYNFGLDKLRADTGNWLLNGNQDFEEWKSSPNSFAWLNGKAGSGKSVLSSSIIKHLKETNDPETAVAFYYFSFTDKKTQSVNEMLCSLIKQICCCRPNTPPSVEVLNDYKERGHHPDRKTLENSLLDTIYGFSRVYIILDALDECPSGNGELEKLLESVSHIHEKGFQALHLLCTSRRETDIEEALEPILSSHPNIDVDLSVSANRKALDYDINLYIDSTFKTAPFKSWPSDLQDEAKTALIEKADGMFQYVACQFDALQRHKARDKILAALADLPRGLDATYSRILQAVDPDYQIQVANVLKWLAFSIRPLELEEVAEIFILDHSKDLVFNEGDRLCTAENVISYLSGLVTKVPKFHKKESIEIRFVHFSVKEYLCSTRITEKEFATPKQESHLHIAESCLAYQLQLSELRYPSPDTLAQYALWRYCARHWIHHLENLKLESWPLSVRQRVIDFLTPKSSSLLSMMWISVEQPIDLHGKDPSGIATPLWYAASEGAYQVCSLLIQNGASPNEVSFGEKGETPLHIAVEWFHTEVVKLLLESGADINAQMDYGNALQLAARNGHIDIVRILLENGANINTTGRYLSTPLQGAAIFGHKEIVQILLDNGANTNIVSEGRGTALQGAAMGGNKEIVQMLLDNGADINATRGKLSTALQAAAAGGHKGIVQMLLDNGADVIAKSGYFGNALQAAIATKHFEAVELLLQRGATIYSPGEEWEELLVKIRENENQNYYSFGKGGADRLEKYQENPTGYMISWRERRFLKRAAMSIGSETDEATDEEADNEETEEATHEKGTDDKETYEETAKD